MTRFPPRGLYAITPDRQLSTGELEIAVRSAIEGGAVALQYRNKRQSSPNRLDEAAALVAVCRDYRVPLIVNDDVGLAAEIGANGIHLGKDDLSLAEARAKLGTEAVIGISCYASPQRAVDAAMAGADYVAFGSFYPSPTKPNAVICPLSVLRQARSLVSIPIVAIGGITAKNGAALVDAGADLLAVINGLFGQSDVRSAAVRLARMFG